MANCCSTDIMIYSPDKDKLEKKTLFDEFQEKLFDEDASVWLRKWEYAEATAWH